MTIRGLLIIATVAIVTMGVSDVQKETKTASDLLYSFLESVSKGNAEASAAFFADSGYIEAPYVGALGMPSMIKGKEAIKATLSSVKQTAPNLSFKNIKVIMQTPTEVVAEYESEATMANAKPYRQHYIAHLVSKNGEIIAHREFLNTVVFVEAFFPNGLRDLIDTKK